MGSASGEGRYFEKVGLRPGFHNDNKDTGVLTESDLSEEPFRFPIFDADMDQRSNLQHKTYVLNKTGVTQRVLATPLHTQFKHEDEAEPENYDMYIDETLEQNEFFAADQPNTVYMLWSDTEPNDMYRKGNPSQVIQNPAGKVCEFIHRNGKIVPVITDDHILSPKALRFVNSVGQNVEIWVQVFSTNPLLRDPRSKIQPDWSAKVLQDRHQDYVHIVTYTWWIAQCFDRVTPNALDDSVFTSKNYEARTSSTRRFEVGSVKWWDFIQEVPPGSYLILVCSETDTTNRYKILAYSYRSLNLIRQSQYFAQ